MNKMAASAKCEQCGKEFKSEHALKIHTGRLHGGKPAAKRGRKAAAPKAAPRAGGNICEVCGRSFGLPMHLARHMSAAHGRPGKRKAARRARVAPAARVARTARPAGRPQRQAGPDVSGLTVDQLLSLKSAVDERLAEIVQKMREAQVSV
jgi:hypothetical protein